MSPVPVKLVATLTGLCVLAVASEMCALMLLAQREFAEPVTVHDLGSTLIGSVLLSGPFVLLSLVAMRTRSPTWQVSCGASALVMFALNAFAIYDAWTEF